MSEKESIPVLQKIFKKKKKKEEENPVEEVKEVREHVSTHTVMPALSKYQNKNKAHKTKSTAQYSL